MSDYATYKEQQGITAKNMRQLAEDRLVQVKSEELVSVLDYIHRAAKGGELIKSFGYLFYPETTNALKARGFKMRRLEEAETEVTW